MRRGHARPYAGRAGAQLDGDVAELIRRRHVSVVTLPPSLLRVPSADDLPTLRTVVSAGEACTREVVDRWAPGRHFVNAYGPSEMTVCSTMKIFAAGQEPTLGQPLEGVSVYFLDADLRPVSRNESGEPYVAGVERQVKCAPSRRRQNRAGLAPSSTALAITDCAATADVYL